ncbi:MAG: hypothetical protein IPN86_04780 [Saprospiraceae bacterium]|nr:hypothetical protein [Saprospiraceae bacterium]
MLWILIELEIRQAVSDFETFFPLEFQFRFKISRFGFKMVSLMIYFPSAFSSFPSNLTGEGFEFQFEFSDTCQNDVIKQLLTAEVKNVQATIHHPHLWKVWRVATSMVSRVQEKKLLSYSVATT